MAKPLSATQTQILTAAAQHEARLTLAPPGLPAAARNAVFRSLFNAGLLEELPAPAEHRDLGWRQEEDGTWIALRLTSAGLQAIGVEPEAATMPAEAAHEGLGRQQAASVAQQASVAASKPSGSRTSLLDAAAALLDAWDAGLERPALPAFIEALRAALMGH
ncbi:MAG TPA: hypothetical protein VIL69_22650 [Roseomonas sp.]|jgi:hypothetical protein